MRSLRPNLLDHRSVRDYLRPRFLVSVETAERRIALTFDDGPCPRNTPALLDLLAARGIRATFFLIGFNARRHPGLVRRIAAEGHEIANHTYHHLPLTLLPDRVLEREVRRADELIDDLTGRPTLYVRPPYGWFSNKVLRTLRRLGYRPVIGSIHPQDSRRPGAERIVSHVLGRMEPGAIVILHDGGRSARTDRSQTVEATARIADRLLADGYRFQTLTGLVEDGS